MENLNLLLEAWRKDHDIAKVIDQNITLDPIQVQSFLQSMPEEKRGNIQSELQHIANSLAEYIATLEDQKIATKAQIDQSVENVKACISYTSADSLRNKKPREE